MHEKRLTEICCTLLICFEWNHSRVFPRWLPEIGKAFWQPMQDCMWLSPWFDRFELL